MSLAFIRAAFKSVSIKMRSVWFKCLPLRDVVEPFPRSMRIGLYEAHQNKITSEKYD